MARSLSIQKPTRLPSGYCPNCCTVLDAATGLEVPIPMPGDPTICAYCRSLLVFDDDLRPRAPTEQETAELESDKELWAILSALTQRP